MVGNGGWQHLRNGTEAEDMGVGEGREVGEGVRRVSQRVCHHLVQTTESSSTIGSRVFELLDQPQTTDCYSVSLLPSRLWWECCLLVGVPPAALRSCPIFALARTCAGQALR